MSPEENPPATDPPKDAPPENASDKKPKSKRKLIIWFTIGLVVISAGVFFWWFFWGRFTVSTNDAYVHGNQVRLNPQVSGIVTAIHADNTQLVKEGQVLVELDRTDRLIDFLHSRSQLGQAIRQVSQMFEKVYVIASQVEVAESNLIQAEVDYLDRKHIVDTGAVSDEEFIHAEVAFVSAKATLKKVKFELLQALSEVQNTKVSTHPIVEKAQESVRQAWVNLQRCVLKAPATGIVAQRHVQVGESVSPNMTLLTIVPLNQMWVNANFKEIHLSKIRIGQPVHMKADSYGGEVIYQGEVIGIEGGSGAVFSALPPQNATGNWIKIVQRVPVRISLHQDQLIRYPLRLGLTMDAHVDVRDTQGHRIPDPSSGKTIYKTDIFQEQILGSDEVIEEIFQENLTCDLDISEDIENLCQRLQRT